MVGECVGEDEIAGDDACWSLLFVVLVLEEDCSTNKDVDHGWRSTSSTFSTVTADDASSLPSSWSPSIGVFDCCIAFY